MKQCKYGHTRGFSPSGKCKECWRLYMNAYHAKNKKKINSGRRSLRANNLEEFRERDKREGRQKKERNPEVYRKIGREWARRNMEAATRWQREHPEERRAVKRAWAKRNKPAINATHAKRRALKKNAIPPWADLEKIKEIYKNCPEGHHVDHTIPLVSDKVCGLHVEANLQYLPALENLKKRNHF